MSSKRFQQTITLVSVVVFFGPTVYEAIEAINKALKQPKENATTTVSGWVELNVRRRVLTESLLADKMSALRIF